MKKNIKSIAIVLVLLVALTALFVGCSSKSPNDYLDNLVKGVKDKGIIYSATLTEGDKNDYKRTIMCFDNGNVAVSDAEITKSTAKENLAYFYINDNNIVTRFKMNKDVSTGIKTGTKKLSSNYNEANRITAFDVNNLILTEELVAKLKAGIKESDKGFIVEGTGTQFDGYALSVDAYGMHFIKGNISLVYKQKAKVQVPVLTQGNEYIEEN